MTQSSTHTFSEAVFGASCACAGGYPALEDWVDGVEEAGFPGADLSYQ